MENTGNSYLPTGQEFTALMEQLTVAPYYPLALQYLYPGEDAGVVRSQLMALRSVDEFQDTFMRRFCKYIVDNTIDRLSCDGRERLRHHPPSVFVSNHRDIVLDALLLQYNHLLLGEKTTFEVVGSNLFEMPMMADMARLNKMVPIGRGGNRREFYQSLSALSAWIRAAVQEGESVWIAQRNGRTKDGRDSTEEAVVKMLAMSGDRNHPETALAALNIVPMSISYEWEPCGVAKARELTLRKQGPYTKAPGEDTQSIISGVLKAKGNVHLAIGKPLNDEIANVAHGDVAEVARLLDVHIREGYRLWPNNYIAADMLAGASRHAGHYSPQQRQAFTAYIDEACAENPMPDFRETLLGIYANPVAAKQTDNQ